MPRRCPRSSRPGQGRTAAHTAWPPAPPSCRPGTCRSRSLRRSRSRTRCPDLRLGRLLRRRRRALALLRVQHLDLVERVLDWADRILRYERQHLLRGLDRLLRLGGVLRTFARELLAREVYEGCDGLQNHLLRLDLPQGVEQLLLGRLLGLVHVATSSAA